MRYCFSGHESFLCRALWLKKGYDFIADGNRFSDQDAVIKLGVGKNMVLSIRYWMRAFGLLANEEFTPLAHYLFQSQGGKDPFAEDTNTLWLLHYLLVTRGVASIYGLLFLGLQREKHEFDRKQVQAYIRRVCNVPEQKNVYNENTVKKDISVCLQNYCLPLNPSTNEEYTGLLISLGLIQRNRDSYYFNTTSKDQIDPHIVLFALLDIGGGDKTVSGDKLRDLGLLFCLPFMQLQQLIRDLCSRYSDLLAYTDNSGIRNVHFLREVNALSALNLYYSHDV